MSIEDPEFPYDAKAQIEIKEFFKNIASTKVKKKVKFFYKRSPESGDLEVYDKKTGDLLSSIPMYYYRGLTKEEYTTMDKLRVDAIVALEEQIDIQKGLLRDAYDEFKKTRDSEVYMQINNEIKALELQKTFIRSPIRQAKIIESIETRRVNFDELYEKRKATDIQFTIYRDFPLWKLHGKYTDSKEVLEVSEQDEVVLLPGEVFLKNGKIARIFNDVDNENKFLSIFIQRDFIYDDVKYSSPYQAFEAVRLLELGYEDLHNEILKTRGTRLIKMIGKKINKALIDTKLIWRDILSNFYQQNEDLLKELLATKNDILVFANSISYLGGVGINAGADEVLDTTLWKKTKIDTLVLSPNIVGEVLMELRAEFKENDISEIVKVGGDYSSEVKTVEEQEKAKKAAIINYKKKNY
jgi:predicted NAD-dependent protein-ADP-ribosyltransferase YbiA (DUF1768 family)